MKKILLLIFIYLFAASLYADRIILDCETPETSPGGGWIYYECWWFTCPGDNDLICIDDNPHSGNSCALWQCNALWSSGVLILDPSWAGIDFSTMSCMEFWARSEVGGESCTLNLISYDGISAYFSGDLIVSGITTAWKQFTFTKDEILLGAEPGFSLANIEGIEFHNASAGTRIYFDDMIFRTCGLPEIMVLDGDTAPASQRTGYPCGDPPGGEIMPFWGSPCIVTTNYNPAVGLFCEKIKCGSAPSGILAIYNRYFAALDITEYSALQFYIKGENGGENPSIRLMDGSGGISNPINFAGLTTAWSQVTVSVSDLAQSSTLNLANVLGIQIQFTGADDIFYIDDMKFPANNITVSASSLTPSTVNNIVDNIITISFAAKSLIGNITNVELDLSSIGAGQVYMTNISGSTLWQYTHTVPQGTSPGIKKFSVILSDDLNLTCGPMNLFSLNVTAPSAPPIPSITTINAVSTNEIDLVWSNVLNETSYTLFRSIDNETNTALPIFGSPENMTSHNDTGLNPGTVYYYWVKAYNSVGSSKFSTVAFATTFSAPPPAEPPCRAWDLGTDSLQNYITVRWRPCLSLPLPRANYDYQLYRSTIQNFETNANNLLTTIDGSTAPDPALISYDDGKAKKGTVYYYKVVTVDTNGLKSEPSVEVSGCAGNKLKITKGFANVSKGEIPEISYRIDEDEPVLVKARIIDLVTGNIVYQTPEEYKSNEEYRFVWDKAVRVKNGVYLVEILMKRNIDTEFKVVSRERIVIVK